MNCLELFADVSQIFTGTIALISAVWYFGSGYFRICKLNSYLREIGVSDANEGKKGQRSVIHLMAKVGMTEDQLFRASFWSCHVHRFLKEGKEGMASHILFGYRD